MVSASPTGGPKMNESPTTLMRSTPGAGSLASGPWRRPSLLIATSTRRAARTSKYE